MTTDTVLTGLVEKGFRAAFPAYPIALSPDPDDARVLYVELYCVPDAETRSVKDRAYDLIEACWEGNTDLVLIPSIKTLTVTREHYPEYLRGPEPAAAATANDYESADAPSAPVPLSCQCAEDDNYVCGLDLAA